MRSRITRLLLALGLFAELTILFLYDIQGFTRQSDEASTLLAGHEMLHGNFLLSGWVEPPDSFWLLDDLLNGVASLAFGVRPVVLYVVPALLWSAVVLLSVRATACDQGRLTFGASLVLVALLVLPPFEYGDGLRFLGDSPGHIATLACALAGILSANHLVRAAPGKSAAATVYAFTLIACVTSDPFSAVIYLAPMAIALAVELLAASRRKAAAKLLLASLAVCGASRISTRILLHHRGFISSPANHGFASPDLLLRNAQLFAHDIMTIYGANPFARHQADFLLGPFPAAMRFVSLMLLCVCLLRSAKSIRRPDRQENGLLERFLVAGLFLSGIALLFSRYLTDVTSVRYFSAALVYGAILVARHFGASKTLRPVFVAQLAIAILMLLRLEPGTNQTPMPPGAIRNLTESIAQLHVGKGYAGYWNASILTVYAERRFVVRPITQGGPCGLKRYAWLSNANWYSRPASANENRFFLVLDKNDLSLITPDEVERSLGAPILERDAGRFQITVFDSAKLPSGCLTAFRR